MSFSSKIMLLIALLMGCPFQLAGLDQFSQVQSLSFQGVLTICLFLVVIVVLLMEYAAPDITLFLGGIVFCLTGLVTFDDFLRGFSTPALLTLCMLFMLMKALEHNGILSYFGTRLLVDSPSRRLQLLRMCLPIIILSNGISNTILALFYTPLIRRWTVERGLYPSEYLIPVAFLSVLGSNMTMMGSSANLVVEALLENIHSGPVFHLFTIAPLGALVAVSGLIFMLTIGYRMLPKRQVAATPFHHSYNMTLELRITHDSFLMGRTLGELFHSYLRDLSVLEIHRLGQVIVDPDPGTHLQVNDSLILLGDVARLLELKRLPGLQFVQDATHLVEFSSTHYGEAVLASASELIGKTIRQVQFRTQFGASVIGIYREGKRLEDAWVDTPLRAGDVLFLLSREPLSSKELIQRNFFLTRQAHAQPSVSIAKSIITVIIVLLMIAVAYASGSLLYASSLAVVLTLAFGLVDVPTLRKAIHWDIVVQIGSGMVYSKALTASGVAAWAAAHLHPFVEQSPHRLIALIFLLTMLMAQVLTTVCCVMIVFPVALTLMYLSGFGGPSSLLAIGAVLTIASTTCFLSPVGYQVNTIIYSAGGYRFSDFARVGLPLALIVGIITVLFIPWWWPLQRIVH